MQEDISLEPSADYLQGFNDGYILAKYLPEIAAKLAVTVDLSERGQGFKEGRQEHILEMNRELYPSWLKDDYGMADKDIAPDKDKEIDKDDYEPEKE